jgi:CheY-like chemotaxis protein
MSAQRKVLVVDDDPVVGESFNRVLSGKGYAVITAENGQEALAKLESEQYDVVFTDLRMPGMTGLEVAERVKARQPWTPVVIVTGYGSQRSEERARAAGVSDFLHKPLSPDMIEDSTARALSQPATSPVAMQVPAAVAAPAEPEAVRKPNVLKNMVLFLLAPFVGLVYAVLLPFVGAGMLAYALFSKSDAQKAAATPPAAE